jgi:hypothetical protein
VLNRRATVAIGQTVAADIDPRFAVSGEVIPLTA